MANKNGFVASIKALDAEMRKMDVPSLVRLYSLAHSALHPVYLEKVIAQCPLNDVENNLYLQMASNALVAEVVKGMSKRRLKSLGVWNEQKPF